MKEVLIVEGPRCAGKTELVNAFVNRHGWKLFKSERGKSPYIDMLYTLDMIRMAPENTHFVFDRFHLTEFIMSLYLERGHPSDIFNYTREISEKLRNGYICGVSAVLILNPPIPIIEARLTEREGNRKADMPPAIASMLWDWTAKKFHYEQAYFDTPAELDEFVDVYSTMKLDEAIANLSLTKGEIK